MYKVCSTLINSLKECCKAIRRKTFNKLANVLMFLSNAIVKQSAKFFTREELEDLKKQGDEINSALAVFFKLSDSYKKESISEIY